MVVGILATLGLVACGLKVYATVARGKIAVQTVEMLISGYERLYLNKEISEEEYEVRCARVLGNLTSFQKLLYKKKHRG